MHRIVPREGKWKVFIVFELLRKNNAYVKLQFPTLALGPYKERLTVQLPEGNCSPNLITSR